MAKTAAEMIRGAFGRVRDGRLALVHYVTITPAGRSVYSVGSTADVDSAYAVTVLGDEFVCTCPAADKGLPACWHRAAVATVRASRLAHGLPADGPNAGDERAEIRARAVHALSLVLAGDLDGAERVSPIRTPRSAAEIAALFAA